MMGKKVLVLEDVRVHLLTVVKKIAVPLQGIKDITSNIS